MHMPGSILFMYMYVVTADSALATLPTVCNIPKYEGIYKIFALYYVLFLSGIVFICKKFMNNNCAKLHPYNFE